MIRPSNEDSHVKEVIERHLAMLTADMTELPLALLFDLNLTWEDLDFLEAIGVCL